MDDIYADLDNKTPCIFILSTGADPTSMLLRFAKVTQGCRGAFRTSIKYGSPGYA